MNLDASRILRVTRVSVIVCQVRNQTIKPKCNGIRLVNLHGHLIPRYRRGLKYLSLPASEKLQLPIYYRAFSASALCRISETNPWSLTDSRLISTFANAPSIVARARADAVVKSDFMFGFVIGFSLSAISATSFARSATLKGTLVACFRAVSIRPSPSAEL